MLLTILSNIVHPQHEAIHPIRHKAARAKPSAMRIIEIPSKIHKQLSM